MTDVENRRPRGRPPAFDRGSVLRRAMEAFRLHGFDGASIPMLSEAMGISAQSLYAAFGSKDALYREAVDLYMNTDGAFSLVALREDPDAISAATRLLREAACVYTEKDGCGCMILGGPSAASSGALDQLCRDLRNDTLVAIERRFTDGVAEGRVKAGTDCATWARYVTSTLYGMSVQARDGASKDLLTKVAAVAAANLETLRA